MIVCIPFIQKKKIHIAYLAHYAYCRTIYRVFNNVIPNITNVSMSSRKHTNTSTEIKVLNSFSAEQYTSSTAEEADVELMQSIM